MYVEGYEPTEAKFEIKRAKLEDDFDTKATIIFSLGNNSIEIVSSEPDFIQFAGSLQLSYRNGKRKLMEIKDTNKYYKNMHHFISEKGDAVSESIKMIQEGKGKLPKEFDLEKAIFLVLDGKFDSQEVRSLTENYFEVIANEILKMQFILYHFELFKKKTGNIARFEDFSSTADKVIQENLMILHPLKSIEVYRSASKADLDLIAINLSSFLKTSGATWNGLSSFGKTPIEGQIAARTMIKEYQDFFELSQKMLRDLALIVGYKNGKSSIGSYNEIENILKPKYAILVASVDELLRHCGVHIDIDLSEKGIIKLIDSRGSKPRIVKIISYEELIEKKQKIMDLTYALFFSTVMCRTLLFFRALDSPDLKFRVIENMK